VNVLCSEVTKTMIEIKKRG